MSAERPTPQVQRLTVAAFIAGAALGGVLAGALGGLVGAGLGLATLAVARAAWPAPLRALTALLLLMGGFGALWVGAGFVRATLMFIEARSQVP
jgi:hypothetical protein